LEARTVKHGLALADRVALVALGGVLISLVTWVAFAYVDAVVLLQGTLQDEILSPMPDQTLARLATVVLILVGTLLIQVLYARRIQVEERLRFAEARIIEMYENSPESVLCIQRDHTVAYANPASRTMAGAQALSREFLGEPCYHALWGREEPCEECLVPEVLATRQAQDRTICDPSSGKPRYFEQVVYPVLDDRGLVESLVETTRDTTERELAQQMIEHMAYYDSLTELPNRALFLDRLRTGLARARRYHEILAVVYADLDDFKAINDTLGHLVGDQVLKAVADRLSGLLREEDTIARQSGDEFTIIARLSAREDADVLAQRILRSLAAPFRVEGRELHLSACIGIAVYPYDGDADAVLLRNADAAMYRAKEYGHNLYRVFSPEMTVSSIERLGLESSLRQAVDRGELVLHYQPQVDTRTQALVGVEALVRWNHPQRGLLLPGAFLDVAEQAGLMGEIGLWVLETACAQAQAWLSVGLDCGRMAVNISAREFAQGDVAANVTAVLGRTGLDPGKLEVEITESTAMHNVEHVLGVLELLRGLGVRVAIDDFGTGHSSLSSLKRFPFTTLKIAQDFMRDVDVHAPSAAIASMLIDLCRELKLDVVAEGVETPSQLDFLTRRKCYVVQGHLFSRALPPEDIEARMECASAAGQVPAAG
jgi:diguanylate cyclase (GGDEF)-like protein